jgi:hypothetical protein
MPSYTLYTVAPQDLYEGSTPYKFSYGMTVDIGEKSFDEYMHTSEQQDAAVQWIPDTVVMNGTQRWFPGTRTIDGNTIFVHFLELTATNWIEHSGRMLQQAECAIMIREP